LGLKNYLFLLLTKTLLDSNKPVEFQDK